MTWLATTPTGRLVATSILWALAITGLALYDNGHLWVGFVLGLLLPITLWIAYEGFWLPKRSRLDYFLALTPTEFEHAVADLLRPLRFTQIRVIGGVDDYGVDVLCRDTGGNLVAIQCKRYQPDNDISSSAVQTFMGGMVAHEAKQGIMVTTSSFSGPARELAASQDIRLIDGVDLSGLLSRSLM
jgi:hypothetical protein